MHAGGASILLADNAAHAMLHAARTLQTSPSVQTQSPAQHTHDDSTKVQLPSLPSSSLAL